MINWKRSQAIQATITNANGNAPPPRWKAPFDYLL